MPINIVIPMAGNGKRFAEAGYSLPKPLIDVKGRPMISHVIDNVRPDIDHKFTFICRREHCQQFNLEELLDALAPGCNIVTVEKVTEGAACTVLLAADFFNNDSPLVLANSDQLIDLDIDSLISDAQERGLDGDILTFQSAHPKWSYAKLSPEGLVECVAEKEPISSHATVGIYYFEQGSLFFEGAVSMIEKNIRVNGEFYVCPVYNEILLARKKVGIFEIAPWAMHGLGTPEDLQAYEAANDVTCH